MSKVAVFWVAVVAVVFCFTLVPYLGQAFTAWQWKGKVVNLESGGDVISHVRVETRGFVRDVNLKVTRGDWVAEIYDPSLREVSVEAYPGFWEFLLWDHLTLGPNVSPTRTWTVHTFRFVDLTPGRYSKSYRIQFCNVVRFSGLDRAYGRNRPDKFGRDCKELHETPPEIVEIYRHGAGVAGKYRPLPELPKTKT